MALNHFSDCPGAIVRAMPWKALQDVIDSARVGAQLKKRFHCGDIVCKRRQQQGGHGADSKRCIAGGVVDVSICSDERMNGINVAACCRKVKRR